MTTAISPAELAQRAANAHYAIVARADETASSTHPVYRASRRRLRMAIAVAYGPTLVDRIEECWADGTESLAYCAALVRSEVAEEFRYAEDAQYCDRLNESGDSVCVLPPGHDGGCEDGVEPVQRPRVGFCLWTLASDQRWHRLASLYPTEEAAREADSRMAYLYPTTEIRECFGAGDPQITDDSRPFAPLRAGGAR